MAITKIWWLVWSRSKGDKKYYSYQVWENIAAGIAVNILDKLGLLGFLAKPRSLDDIEKKINNDALFNKVSQLIKILNRYGYINMVSPNVYQVNSEAIKKLMKTLETYPHTAFKPLLIAAERFLDEVIITQVLEKGEINIHDPRLIAIYREVFTSDFLGNQIESIMVWAGVMRHFYNKDILLLFSNLGNNARFLIDKLGYRNIKKLIVAERTESTLELAKRLSVNIGGEKKLLSDLDKVEFVTIGQNGEKLSEVIKPDSVDTVLSIVQLYTVKDLSKLFSDIYNVLRKNGAFIGAIPMKGQAGTTTLLDLIASLYGWRKIYSIGEIKELLKRVGFRKIKIDYSFYLRGIK